MNVLLVLGHPRTDSFCAGLARAYRDGALEAATDVEYLELADLEFDPHVRVEDPSDQRLEADLVEAQRSIRWADHLVFVYPNWWGTMPALLKGFFDRVFTPGFAFASYDEDEGAGHEELLSDKTAELILTMDTPPWVYRLFYRQPGITAVKRATLGYAGVRTTRVTTLGPIESSTLDDREAWLEEATQLGRNLASGPESRVDRAIRTATTWLGALRLQFYPMSLVAYTIGALAAAGSSGGSVASGGADTVFGSLVYWLGFAFLFCLEAATVLSNEYVDYETDRENTFAGPFTGGSRVLVDDELEFEEVRAGAAVALVLAAAFGLGVVIVGAGTPLTMAAVMGVLAVLALGYTIPPLKLSYRTLGELDVAVTHSVGVLLCGYVFFGGTWTDPLPWLLAVPFLLSILPSITLAGVPDYDADRAAGKRTIAVRFGVEGAGRVAQVATVLAALTGVTWYVFELAGGAYGPLIFLSVPHALALVWQLERRRRRGDLSGRIDGPLATSLAYIGWFAAAPLIGLL